MLHGGQQGIVGQDREDGGSNIRLQVAFDSQSSKENEHRGKHDLAHPQGVLGRGWE